AGARPSLRPPLGTGEDYGEISHGPATGSADANPCEAGVEQVVAVAAAAKEAVHGNRGCLTLRVIVAGDVLRLEAGGRAGGSQHRENAAAVRGAVTEVARIG